MSQVQSAVYRDLAEVKDLWLALERRAGTYPFQSHGWVSAWFETVGQARAYSPVVVVLSDEGGRKALFPLACRKRRALAVLEWAGTGVSDYGAALVEDGFSVSTDDIIGALRKLGSEIGCELLLLERIPGTGPYGSNILVGAGTPRMHVSAHHLETPDSMEAYLEERFSSKARYNLRRAEKKLGGGVVPEFFVPRDTAVRHHYLEAVIAQKRHRYAKTGDRDPFDDPAVTSFYHLADRTVAGAEVSGMVAEGTIVAAHWGVRDEKTLYVLLPSFDGGEAARHSPGILLALNLIRSCVEGGQRIVDFTIGDEEYKDRLCSGETPLYAVVAGIGLRGRAHALVYRMVLALKRSFLFDIFKKARKARSRKRHDGR